MDTRLKALFLVSSGVLLVPLGFHLAGDPQAPFSLGGIPQPFYTGIAAGYIVGGGTAYIVAERDQAPTFNQLFRASLLAMPLAFVLSVLLVHLDGATLFDNPRFLALHLGTAVLFYPLAFGLVFGFGTDERDRAMVRVIALVALVVIILLALFAPKGGLGATAAVAAIGVVVLADVVFAYPLYRLALGLRPESTPR